MKKLLEAINRGILKGLNELNIELLTDLDDIDLDSILTKSVNNKIAVYKYFPKTKEELVEIIKTEVEKKGWNCSLNHIDTSKITDMSYLFSRSDFYNYGLEKFNGNISKWDVSNVNNMGSMFEHAEKFNQPIGGWDVSSVKDMTRMFSCAKSFNQPIGNWDVSNVANMGAMFHDAYSFNQPIGDWNVSNVKDMGWMFSHAYAFNQPIGDWNVSNVKNMHLMFCWAQLFNQDLSNWKLNATCETNDIFFVCPIKEQYKPKR